jgi:hypothetical protein
MNVVEHLLLIKSFLDMFSWAHPSFSRQCCYFYPVNRVPPCFLRKKHTRFVCVQYVSLLKQGLSKHHNISNCLVCSRKQFELNLPIQTVSSLFILSLVINEHKYLKTTELANCDTELGPFFNTRKCNNLQEIKIKHSDMVI